MCTRTYKHETLHNGSLELKNGFKSQTQKIGTCLRNIQTTTGFQAEMKFFSPKYVMLHTVGKHFSAVHVFFIYKSMNDFISTQESDILSLEKYRNQSAIQDSA